MCRSLAAKLYLFQTEAAKGWKLWEVSSAGLAKEKKKSFWTTVCLLQLLHKLRTAICDLEHDLGSHIFAHALFARALFWASVRAFCARYSSIRALLVTHFALFALCLKKHEGRGQKA